jgi:dTMP kinase
VNGALIAFEGLDQSGKQTQAERLVERLRATGRVVTLLTFPDDSTSIGREIRRALAGESRYSADVMQLLYVANRYELREEIAADLERGTIVLCDRYTASSVAYGEAQGVDAGWLAAIQQRLPPPDMTILLDIPPDVSARRKRSGRDAFERDLGLLARVRDSYIRQASANPHSWVRIAADRDRDAIAEDVYAAVERVLTDGGPSRR